MHHKNRTTNWKSAVEKGFGQLGIKISHRPILWFTLCLLVIGVIASQLVHLRTDTAIESFLDQEEQSIIDYNEFKDTFGRDEVFIITVEVEDTFKQTFVDNLRAFHQTLEDKVPYLQSVDSLINASHIYGENDTLIIEDLLPHVLPKDPQELKELQSYTYDSPTYQNYLISKDRHLTSVMLRLEPYIYGKDDKGNVTTKYMEDKEMREAYAAINSVVNSFTGTLSDDIRIAGSQPIAIVLGEAIERDFTVFSVLGILLVGIVLGFIFRRGSGVLMPLVVMVLGVTATISFMAILDTPMQMTTSILPSFLLAVCVGDSIHLLTIFFQRYDEGATKNDALRQSLEHTGLAMFFTSITTAAGLASFGTSELSPIASLGIFGAIGSLLAFMLTIFILPCLITLLPIKRRPVVNLNQQKNLINTILYACISVSTRYPKIIVTSGVILFISSTAIATQIQFGHDPLSWFPENHPSILAIEKTQERMGGTMTIEISIDTGKDRGVNNSALLQQAEKTIEDILTWETEHYSIAKIISVVDVIKESNRGLHNNDQTYYSIPEDNKLISQELFLVELDNPDSLFKLIDRKYQTMRITIMIPWVDAVHYQSLLTRLEDKLDQDLQQHAQKIVVTGVAAVLGTTFAEMLYSTAESYILAGIVITLMMILLVGNIKLGLITMIPSLMPITIVVAILCLFGYPLDMFTMLIGSIAIGLTVDDNVHFIHGFRRNFAITGDAKLAIRDTLLSTGRAMFVTSIVLSFGFLIYTQSTLNNMVGFGVLTALCIALALVASFLLAPAFMMLLNKPIVNILDKKAENPQPCPSVE